MKSSILTLTILIEKMYNTDVRTKKEVNRYGNSQKLQIQTISSSIPSRPTCIPLLFIKLIMESCSSNEERRSRMLAGVH